MDVAIFDITLVMVDVEENTGLTPVERSFRQYSRRYFKLYVVETGHFENHF